MRVAKRAGMRKAKVALARKLAVVLHRMLADGTEFIAAKAAAKAQTKGGNREFGRTDTKRPEQVPSPGRWIRLSRWSGSSSQDDCAPQDWPTDPHQTPSGGSSALTPDRSKNRRRGLCSKGIDTGGPVTEAALIH